MMAHTISVNVTCTPGDSLRVAKFLKNQEFLYRNDVLLTSGFVFVVFIVVIVLMADDFSALRIIGAMVFSVVPASVVGIAVFILHKVVNPWLMRRAIAKHFDLSPSACDESLVIFSDDGISVESSLSSSFAKWTALAKVVETDSDVLFYYGPKVSWFVPKSHFATYDDLVSVRQLIQRSLNEKAHLINSE